MAMDHTSYINKRKIFEVYEEDVPTNPEKDLDVHLIDFVKAHRNLYDKSHILYKNQDARSGSWAEISKQLNMTPELVELKWQKIRRFISERAAREKESVSGSGAPQTKPWDLYKDLEFLEDIQHRTSYTNVGLGQKQPDSRNEKDSLAHGLTNLNCQYEDMAGRELDEDFIEPETSKSGKVQGSNWSTQSITASSNSPFSEQLTSPFQTNFKRSTPSPLPPIAKKARYSSSPQLQDEDSSSSDSFLRSFSPATNTNTFSDPPFRFRSTKKVNAALPTVQEPLQQSVDLMSQSVQQLAQHALSSSNKENQEKPTNEALFGQMIANKLALIPEPKKRELMTKIFTFIFSQSS